MEINRREIYRYLGYGSHEADDGVRELVEECLAELLEASAPKSVFREFPLKLLEDGGIDASCFRTVSRNLSKNLKDCERIILFAATLGPGADHLIRRYNQLQMSKAVILQAAAAAAIEEYCDEVNGEIKEEYEGRGLFLRPRFSPGYGDFPLDCQPAILGALETGKRIGLNLTGSLLMVPSKSVSAVIGVSLKPHRCELKGCEACDKKDCAYRR